jgi:protein O-GlcNAc transferase
VPTRPRRSFQKRHFNTPDPDRSLKIGYVSPDMRDRPVGRFLLPLLQKHDHRAFEITCYAGAVRSDAVKDCLRDWADVLNTSVDWTEKRLTEQIRQDCTEILVNLSLHSGGNCLPIFAGKPAPVQVTCLAYPCTCGVEAMDYRDRSLP